jgi:predicted dehydrogenase
LASIQAENGLEDSLLFTALEQFLDAPQDITIVTVPHTDGLHQEFGSKVLSRGNNLLIEKPFCDTLTGAKQLVSLAREAGKKIMVGQNFRYHPQVMKAREWVQDGKIGNVISADIAMRSFFGPDSPAWRLRQSHPHLFELGIHSVDLIRHVLGADASRVVSSGLKPSGSHFAGNSFSSMLIELTNGVHVNWTGTVACRGNNTSPVAEWTIYGSLGVVCINDSGARLIIRPQDRTELDEQFDAKADSASGRDLLIEQFVDALEAGTSVPHSGEDNLQTMGIVFAAVESERSQAWVDVPGMLG